jgi:hypothetical protein
MRPRLLGCLLFVSLAVCGDATVEPLPFQVSLQANRSTAAPGDNIDFVVIAQGGSLLGVEMDYGDTNTDLFATSGARTAQVTFHHVFADAGTYDVRATVTDALAGQKDASVQVVVQ